MSFGELDGHDAYALLGIPEDADEQAVRRAFVRQVRAVHPDLVQDLPAGAADRLRLLKAARDVLLKQRSEYDRHRAPATAPPEPRRDRGGVVLLAVVLLGYLFALVACVSFLTG